MIKYIEKLEILNALNLPKDQYLIWGSGPLAVRNIRDSHDIDIVVLKNLWKTLTKKYPPQKEKKNLIKIKNIEIWSDCLLSNIDELFANRDLIDGYPFMSLHDTIKWKKFLSREKDTDDIVLIEKFLKNNSK